MTPAQRTAHAHDLEREHITRRTTRAFHLIGKAIQRQTILAFRDGANVEMAVQQAARDLPKLIEQSMVAAHVAGAARSIRAVEAAKGRTLSLSNPFEDIMAKFQKVVTFNVLPVAGASIYEALANMYRGPAQEAAALYVGHAQETLMKAVRESIAAGEHVRAGTLRLREAFDSVGIGASDARVETVFRTQANAAYNGGRWGANQSPELDEIIWGYESVSVGDDRTTPLCLECDGVRLPKAHAWWKKWWPPRHYGCRSSTVELFHGDSDATPTVPPPDALLESLPGFDASFQGHFGMLGGV